MTEKRRKRKKQKMIRGAIRAVFCLLTLALTVGLIRLVSKALEGKLPADPLPVAQSSGSGNNLISGSAGMKRLITTSAPTSTPTEQKSVTICLDAGHGGKDVGSEGASRTEKDDTLKLTLATAEYLKGLGIDVVLTRSDDTFLELSERCDVANNAKAAYFVSIHRNKGPGEGVETWIYSKADEEINTLAENIMDKLDEAGIQRNRGVKRGMQTSSSKDYYLTSHSDMPSCIIELGFMDNETDNQMYDEKQEAYAKAIGDAILATCDTYHGTTAGKLPGDSATADQDDADASKEGADGETQDKDQQPESTSHTITNTPVEDLASLDNTTQDWGPGADADDLNRPYSALSYHEKYEKYNANFIVPDTGDKKLIYLTLDEGYEYGCTPAILDTLKEKNVKVVFFVTKAYVKDQPELVQRMIDEGHMVGNHSVTHPADGLPSQSIEQQQVEVMDNHEYVKENFNYEMHLFRYPAGKFSDQSLAVINNCNYKSVFWSFAYLDYDVNNQPDPTEALNKLISKLHTGGIFLLHAESTTNTQILGDFIDKAREAGYEFALFD